MKLHYWNVIIRYSIQLALHKSLNMELNNSIHLKTFFCISDVVGISVVEITVVRFCGGEIFEIIGNFCECFWNGFFGKLYWVWKKYSSIGFCAVNSNIVWGYFITKGAIVCSYMRPCVLVSISQCLYKFNSFCVCVIHASHNLSST